MRRAARVDASKAGIVRVLDALGCSVLDLDSIGRGCPDILVGYKGRNILLEIKTPKERGVRSAGKVQENQAEWHQRWRGSPVRVVYGPDDVIRALGLGPPE